MILWLYTKTPNTIMFRQIAWTANRRVQSLNIYDDCADIRVSLPNVIGGALPNDPAHIVVSASERLLAGENATAPNRSSTPR